MSKKTTDAIIGSGNDYLIGVKKNQPTLYHQIADIFSDKQKHSSSYVQIERSKGRSELRHTMVSNCLNGISEEWVGLHQIVAVYRRIKEKGKVSEETAYFISSRKDGNALCYAEGVRSHWGIENGLHFVKDGTFKEDASRIRTGNAPQNISTLKNIGINLFRNNDYTNMAEAIRLVANDIWKLCKIIHS